MRLFTGWTLQYPSVLYVVGENSIDDLYLAVLKLDLDGNLALAYTYDEGKKEMGKDITIGEAGNVYVIGHRTDSTLLFLKFDTAGNKLWDRRRFGHLGGHVLYSEDGVYFAGWYYLIFTFYPKFKQAVVYRNRISELKLKIDKEILKKGTRPS